MSNFIIAQIISIFTIIFACIAITSKSKKHILLWYTFVNITLAITYLLLGSFLSLILVGGAMLRTIIFYIYAKHNKSIPLYYLICFELFFITSSIILLTNMFDILLLLNLCILTYTTWQINTKLLRIGYVLSSVLLITYNVLVGAYVSIISECILLSATVYAIIVYDILKKQVLPKVNKSSSPEQTNE